MARQVFPFLLARNCRMLPSNPSNPPKHARPALGAASCGTPSLSFSTSPKLPDAPFKPFKPFKPFQTGAWSCQLWQAKSFLFLLPCNCRMLPSNPRNLPTPATFGVDFILSSSWRSWSCQTATSFVFIGSTMPDASLKPSKPYTLKLAVCLRGCC